MEVLIAIEYMVLKGFKVELSYQADAVDLKYTCHVTGFKPEEYAYSRGDHADSIKDAVMLAYRALRKELGD